MKESKLMRNHSQPLGNFLSFLEATIAFEGMGRPRGFRRFRKTHLENILPRGSRDRGPRYLKGVPRDQKFLLKNLNEHVKLDGSGIPVDILYPIFLQMRLKCYCHIHDSKNYSLHLELSHDSRCAWLADMLP